MTKHILAITLMTVLLWSCGGSNGGSDSDGGSEVAEAPSCDDLGYPPQESSPYVLPYEAGRRFVVGQGNCTDGSHSEDQRFAYDFDMPIGTTITASRAGRVIQVEERFEENNGTPGEENFIVVEHSDGTVAGYYHLTQDGASVELDEMVAQGEVLGLSGNTGDSSEAHLHFEVLDNPGGETLPVTFRNTREHRNGLVEGQSYEAGSR